MKYKYLVAGLVIAACVVVGGVWLWADGRPQSAVGQLTATPSGYVPTTPTAVPNLVVNTPTVVRFAIQIDEPTLNPTTVRLERVDSSGKLLSTVGRLYDDGTHGDRTGGDKAFNGQFTLTETTVGRLYFRAGGAFRGNTVNAWSSSIALDIDSTRLPPDPGEAGKSTLQGIDADHDGLRDDVQRYLSMAFVVPSKHAAAVQYALNRLRSLEATNTDEAQRDFAERVRSIECLEFVMGQENYSAVSDDLTGRILNTHERIVAASHVSSLLSGNSFSVRPYSAAFALSCDR
jgi:hypothetical protein